jgi:predicted  nucleic acid-binding Zn-ribbon protein
MVPNGDLEALLAVQADDAAIRDIEARRDALAPRLTLLDATQKRVVAEVARTESALERELTRQRILDARLADTRAMHERAAAALASAERLRDAAAAATQVETMRRAMADGESEALVIVRRIADLRTALSAHREVLAQVSSDQGAARAELEQQRAELDAELATARARRQLSASAVTPGLLAKYERIALRRRAAALIEVRDFCCSACDTAIPLQRRPVLSAGNVIEPCEGCGVLLYQPVPA